VRHDFFDPLGHLGQVRHRVTGQRDAHGHVVGVGMDLHPQIDDLEQRPQQALRRT
jgi:hypothetical protein